MSYLIYVQHPQDLVPVVPQSELQPPIEDRHVEVLLRALGHALNSKVDEIAESLVNGVWSATPTPRFSAGPSSGSFWVY